MQYGESEHKENLCAYQYKKNKMKIFVINQLSEDYHLLRGNLGLQTGASTVSLDLFYFNTGIPQIFKLFSQALISATQGIGIYPSTNKFLIDSSQTCKWRKRKKKKTHQQKKKKKKHVLNITDYTK